MGVAVGILFLLAWYMRKRVLRARMRVRGRGKTRKSPRKKGRVMFDCKFTLELERWGGNWDVGGSVEESKRRLAWK